MSDDEGSVPPGAGLPLPGQKAEHPKGWTVEWSLFKPPEAFVDEWAAAAASTATIDILAGENPELVQRALAREKH